MNMHGVPRMTADLDIMVDLSIANVKKFVKALKDAGYKPKVPVSLDDFSDINLRKKWVTEKNMTVLTLYNPKVPYQELDVFVVNPVEFSYAYKNRKQYKAAGLSLPVASVDDIVAMKEKADRKQDRSDISALRKLKET